MSEFAERVVRRKWPDLADLILNSCTHAEVEALILRENGASEREAALILGISRSSYRDRLDNADRKLHLALTPRMTSITGELLGGAQDGLEFTLTLEDDEEAA